jgi:hypothetical protein
MKKIKIAKNDVWDSVLYLEGAIDEKLSDFSIKLELRLSEAKEVIDHLVQSLIDYEPFINEYLELFGSFIFPLPQTREYLVVEFQVTPDGYFVLNDELYFYHETEIDDYTGLVDFSEETETPHLLIKAAIDYQALGGKNSKETREIIEFLKDIGFDIPKNLRYPYYDHPLGEKEYGWYYEWV